MYPTWNQRSYCYFEQGQALFGLERYEEALAAYKQAQVLGEPNLDPQFYHGKAVVYERLAQRAYEEEKQAKEQVTQAQKNVQAHAVGDFLSTIPGIEPEIQSKLEANGVSTISELLAQTGSKEERGDLSQKAAVSTHMLKTLADRADLMRLQGVTPDIAVMLEEAGVNGCKDLRRRNPEHLYMTLTEAQRSGDITTRTVPGINQITQWIFEAMEVTRSQ